MFKRTESGDFARVTPVDWRVSMLPWQARGLSQTASGYGSKLTTVHTCRLPDDPPSRRRRVYVACYSNNGSAYLFIRSERVLVDDSNRGA